MKIISRKEARALGLKRYFTGNPCKFGHVCQRYVRQATCTICENNKTKRQHARRRLRDPEWSKRENAKAYEKFKESRKEKLRLYSQACSTALAALREIGVIEDKRRVSTRPDNEEKVRSHQKRIREDPSYREKCNSNANKYYWRNKEKCTSRHREYGKAATVAKRALKDLGIKI